MTQHNSPLSQLAVWQQFNTIHHIFLGLCIHTYIEYMFPVYKHTHNGHTYTHYTHTTDTHTYIMCRTDTLIHTANTHTHTQRQGLSTQSRLVSDLWLCCFSLLSAKIIGVLLLHIQLRHLLKYIFVCIWNKSIKVESTRVCKHQPSVPLSYLPPNPGLQPASVVVLPRSLAADFESFCQANHGPLPLLGRCEPEKVLPHLSTVPGIR